MPEYPQTVNRARRMLIGRLEELMPRASRVSVEVAADWLLDNGFLTTTFFAWSRGERHRRAADPDQHNADIGGAT
jgi:hypothetical protein